MKGVRIRPEKQGLAATRFDLEAAIMDVVWGEGWNTFSVGDVHRALEAQREIAYTTVMTTVSRLFDKGLLDRHKEGRKYVYSPTMSREAFAESMAREVMASLPKRGRTAAMALLVDAIEAGDVSELDALEALIRRRRESLDNG